ncbi:hypothetical protein T07_13907 [Trichinella nelsoni]|uniref:Uncharacterized protein n=1 Tax=Trichinella nelsoni TaxID=6336 RepID=A0A0V0RJW1_9BILA|nr:hypothetical protein T07_13907 [Trichinella nelsoni]
MFRNNIIIVMANTVSGLLNNIQYASAVVAEKAATSQIEKIIQEYFMLHIQIHVDIHKNS